MVLDILFYWDKGLGGRTYEVSKDGKLYVAKVGKKNPDNLQEFNIRKEIEKIRSELPEEVAKHLVKHYLIDDTTSNNYFIYIMDKMRPMNKYEEKLLYQGHRGGMPAKSILSLINRDISGLYNFLKEWIINSKELKHIYYYIPPIETVYLEGLKKVFLGTIKDIVFSLSKETYLDEYLFAETLEEYLNSRIYNMYILPKWNIILQHSNDKNFDIREVKAVFRYEIRDAGKEYIRKFLSAVFISSKQSSEPIDTSAAFEKQKSFIDALEYIAQHYGIHWDDLHEDNVMIDPKTNEYVATDIGNFNLYTK